MLMRLALGKLADKNLLFFIAFKGMRVLFFAANDYFFFEEAFFAVLMLFGFLETADTGFTDFTALIGVDMLFKCAFKLESSFGNIAFFTVVMSFGFFKTAGEGADLLPALVGMLVSFLGQIADKDLFIAFVGMFNVLLVAAEGLGLLG